jgi:hypothetical protein
MMPKMLENSDFHSKPSHKPNYFELLKNLVQKHSMTVYIYCLEPQQSSATRKHHMEHNSIEKIEKTWLKTSVVTPSPSYSHSLIIQKKQQGSISKPFQKKSPWHLLFQRSHPVTLAYNTTGCSSYRFQLAVQYLHLLLLLIVLAQKQNIIIC